MKKVFITTTFLLLAVCACEREAVTPAETEYDIPVRVEGLPIGTRTAIADVTGAASWMAGDVIGLYVEGTGYSQYRSAGVVSNSVRLSLSADQHRVHYAVYPVSVADASHHTAADFRLTYPTTYNCGPYSAEELAVWSPAPIVADNTADELSFYHVGGLLRLHIIDFPSGTTTLNVKFQGIDNVAGSYTVSNPGTDSATMTLASGAGNTIRFTNIPSGITELTLNIPLPLQNYDGLASVSVAASGGSANVTAVQPVPGWGNLTRRQGLYCSVDFFSISYAKGSYADGRFGNYYVSPGILKWDASLNEGAGGYTLTDGSDPLEILNYMCATEETNPSLSDVLDVYYHRMTTGNSHSSTTTLRYRQDGEDAFGDLANPYVFVDGETWRVPSSAEWRSIISTRAESSTINGSSAAWIRVLLDLTGSAYEGKGLLSETGAISEERTNYTAGFLLIPNGAVITCSPKSGNFWSFTVPQLRKLIDGGCAFLPYTAYYWDGTWYDLSSAFYWGTTYWNGYNFQLYYTLWGNNSSFTVNSPRGAAFFPARLIHD